jgi:hypothetical protein
MSTCNRLDFQTLGSQRIMPKNLPHHCSLLNINIYIYIYIYIWVSKIVGQREYRFWTLTLGQIVVAKLVCCLAR